MQWALWKTSTCETTLLVTPSSARQQTRSVPRRLRQTLFLISRINFKATLITARDTLPN